MNKEDYTNIIQFYTNTCYSISESITVKLECMKNGLEEKSSEIASQSEILAGLTKMLKELIDKQKEASLNEKD